MFVKNTPQRVVFSQMKHCVSCLICNSLLTDETLHLMLDVLGFQYELNAPWYSSQDPSDFQAAFDELVEYTSSADNWRQIKDELSGRGVWFIVLFFIFTSSNIQGQLYRLQVVCGSLSNHEKTLEQITETTLLVLETTAAPIPIESIRMHERATLPQETLLIVPGNEQFLLNCVN